MTLPHVLIAKREGVVAADLCATVEEAGYIVEGPHSDARSAINALRDRKPDIAILDGKLEDGDVYALAQRLAQEDIPIVFQSDRNARAKMETKVPNATRVRKPCPPADMIAAVGGALEAH